ncbi:hypothetical protein LP415_00565 [Polaromonas sp. P1(28)-8]|nr:hypothetical protein LP415_00565 [Polaromonas sp. P1(28)-8]
MAAILLVAISAGQSFGQSLTTLEKISRDKEIVMGWRDSRPFSFLSDAGKPAGYQIDLCLMIADSIKKELRLETLNIRYVQVDLKTRVKTQGRFNRLGVRVVNKHKKDKKRWPFHTTPL